MPEAMDTLSSAVDDVIGAGKQQTAEQLRNNAQVSATSNPDQEAQYQHLAKFTDVPVDTVRNQPGMIQQVAAAKEIPADDIVANSPATANFLKDQNNARIAMDDIANMRDLENHVSDQSLTGGLVNNFALNSLRAYEGLRTWYGDKTGNKAMTDSAIKDIQDSNDAQEQFVPHLDGIGGVGYNALNGLVGSAPALMVGMLNPLAGAAVFGAQAKVESYGRYRARGGTTDQAGLGSNLEGGIALATSFLPLNYLTEKLGKVGVGEFLSNLLVRDFGSQMAQTVASSAVDTAIANPDKSWTDWAKTLPQQTGEAAVNALMFAGAFGTVNMMANRFGSNALKADAAGKDAAALSALNDKASVSKLRERSPEAFKDFIDKASENGTVQDLYISPKELAQSGIDPGELVKLMPSLNEQLPEAIATGQDVKISVGDFATHIAGSELAQGLIDHLKTDPDGMSKVQADAYIQNEGESFKSEVEKVLATAGQDTAFDQSRKNVEQKILEQLQGTQRYTDDVNTAQAALHSNFYAAMAARHGVMPEEMMDRYPINVQATDPTGGGFNQLDSDGGFGIEGFHSKMYKALDEKLNKSGTAKQYRDQIAAFVKQGHFKKDELYWSGLDDRLAKAEEHKGADHKFTKDEILADLKSNHISIEEVIKDGEAESDALTENDLHYGRESQVDLEEDDPIAFRERVNEEEEAIRDEHNQDPNKAGANSYSDHLTSETGEDDEGNTTYEWDDDAVTKEAEERVRQQMEDFGDKTREVSLGDDHDFKIRWNTETNDWSILDSDGSEIDSGNSRDPYESADTALMEHLRDQEIMRWSDDDSQEGETQYANYQTDGPKEGYKELLFTMPGRSDRGVSQHFNENDPVLMHMRFNERKASDGKKTMFIEEIQSDWHQQAREKGYRDPEASEAKRLAGAAYRGARQKSLNAADPDVLETKLRELLGPDGVGIKNKTIDIGNGYTATHTGDNFIVHDGVKKTSIIDAPGVIYVARELADLIADADPEVQRLKAEHDALPEGGEIEHAPFDDINKYAELAMKRAIMWAVDHDMEKIAWTPGHVQTERYSSLLQRHVDQIKVHAADADHQWVAVHGNGRDVTDFIKQQLGEGAQTANFEDNQTYVKIPTNKLSTIFGKGVADTIVQHADAQREKPMGDLGVEPEIIEGQELTVHDKGMIEVYDKIVRNVASSLIKKFGGKIETTGIDVGKKPKTILDREKTENVEEGVSAIKTDVAYMKYLDENDKHLSSSDQTKLRQLENFLHGLRKEGDRDVPLDEAVSNTIEKNGKYFNDVLEPYGLIAKEQQAETMESFAFDITDKMRESVKAEGMPLFQGEKDNRRGAYNPETATITLLKAADLSTFLHESGHFFLDTLNKMAMAENAPEDIKGDMQKALKWLGVDNIEDWNSRDIEQQRDAHEQFARGFEAYLFEGKSPSVQMQGVFQRFRSWLVNVYKSLGNLNVELSDDIRQVFDRMLATSDHIKEAEAARLYEPFFKTQADAGMSNDEWKNYQDLGIQATLDAQQSLQARSLRDMRWSANAKSRELKLLQKKVQAKRNSMRREVTDEVMNEPANQATQFLKYGRDPQTNEPIEGASKLYIPEVEAMYGDTPAYKTITDKLGYGKYGMLATENGMHPDQVADMFGFSSGDELIRALVANENPKERIAALTDQRMLERYGDLNSPEAMERAAEAAIHNDVRTKFVATEMNALNKAIGKKKILADAARQYAEAMVARLKVRDIQPSRYTNAETRSARNADEARRKGDLQTAAIEKRNQLINAFAAKAAMNAGEEVEKTIRYLKKFDTARSRKSIDPTYIDQINTLRERFDLKDRSLKRIDKMKSLAEWVKSQVDLGVEPDIDPELLNEANRKNYKDMTVEELRGLNDAVKQIEHLGRLKNKLLTARDQRTFAVTVEGMVNSIYDNAKPGDVDNRTRPNEGRAMRTFNGFLASHRKLASLVREFDGFKDGGPVWETMIRTMNEAGDKEASMRSEATEKLVDLIKPIQDGGRFGGKGVFFKSLNLSLNREERLGIALNTGNTGNLQRLLGGENWTMEQIKPVMESLTKSEWDFVQNTWKFFESYRPQIAAKEKRVYGVEPNWVEPQGFTIKTSDGHTIDVAGGYFPIKYDPARSQAADQHSAAEEAKAAMKGAYTSATTRRSFTKNRVEEVTGRPLMYSMDGIYSGINEVIHDLSWHEWLIDSTRLMRSKSLDNAIRTKYGAQIITQMKKALEDIATGDRQTVDDAGRILRHVRTGATIAGLGLNIMNTVINTVGVTQSMVRIGPQWVGRGVSRWMQSPIDSVTEMYGQSEFMRMRGQTQNRELNEVRNSLNGKSKIRQKIDAALFLPMTMTQLAVDTPTWWGAKEKALSEGHDEAKSIALADQAVLDAQGGGQVKDLAAIQRGNEFKKLLTTFYGFFSTTYNLGAESTKRTNFKDASSVMRLGGDYLLLYAVPALLSTMIGNVVKSGFDMFDDKEKLAKQIINDQIGYLFQTMVGVRELTGVAQKALGVNQYNQSYGGPASLRFIQEMDKLGTQIGQGKLDHALFRSLINVGGITLHLPSTQINRTLNGIISMADGKTSNPLALVSGGPSQ